MRRNDPNAGIARSVVASLVFILPAEAREDGTADADLRDRSFLSNALRMLNLVKSIA